MAGNPYVAHYRAKSTAIFAGARVNLTPSGDLADRLRDYAYYIQEHAVDGAEALLVSDLLDAVAIIRRARPTPAAQEDA